MKIFNIKFFVLTAFLFISSGVLAYNWGFSNHTKKTLDIRFGAMGAAGWWYNTVKPGKRTEFNLSGWWAGYCMWGAEWKEEGQGDDKYKSVEIIYLPDDVYNETVKESANIGRGIDTFLCNTVLSLGKAINKGQCPSMFSALIEWIGGLLARSSCRSREFMIYADKDGSPIFTTTLK